MFTSAELDRTVASKPIEDVIKIADAHFYEISCYDAMMATFKHGISNVDVWYSEYCGIIFIFVGKISEIIKKLKG